MAFCPNCEAEYRPGITFCPDCQIDLVPQLTPQNRVHDKEKADMVAFTTFANSAEADMVQELLARNGVRSFVKGGTFSLLPGSFPQDIVLMVDERDLQKATELYKDYFPAENVGLDASDGLEEKPE
ncbi:MAG TPA: DUF2007 domain-containing protein [Blastocatellia bacterium]